jgi:hypothetical protein
MQLGCSDMEKLVVLTMFYGGKMQRMLDSTVTHLVTMDTSGVSTIYPLYMHSCALSDLTPKRFLIHKNLERVYINSTLVGTSHVFT